MSITHPLPELSENERVAKAYEIRNAAARTAHAKADAPQTRFNDDENDFGDRVPANFTKGLAHDEFGFVSEGYDTFVTQVNQDAPSDFVAARPSHADDEENTYSTRWNEEDPGGRDYPAWRGWESPRAGHYFDLEGPDANGVGMAPAPKLGSNELSAEMAEVYAMAILRDVPFSQIEDGSGSDINTALDVESIVGALKNVSFFGGDGADSTFAKRRLAGRLLEPGTYDVNSGDPGAELPEISAGILFRGSGPGAKAGPFVSQFMLVGNSTGSVAGGTTGGEDGAALFSMSGMIAYGNQFIDQRQRVFLPRLDYMTDWNQWLDVQKGADLRGRHVFDPYRRFITTPRHLATYVRFDALYQAYLNACLILLESGYPMQEGFPERGELPRTGFAAFGGPHILSLVTEVATRCLKLARRQKFNFHRRARPERISGLLTIGHAVKKGDLEAPIGYAGGTKAAVETMLHNLGSVTGLVGHHNALRESGPGSNASLRPFGNKEGVSQPSWLQDNAVNNLLLAMAFPEGSPMHPAYAAGHATVAGGCVTMLKAFFQTVDIDTNNAVIARPWSSTGLPLVRAAEDGLSLEAVEDDGATVEGELNKLAANISIGRNMAGVHFYSDYYDSVRMGERVAVGILVEQMKTYDNDDVSMCFRSFDGDLVVISTQFDGFAAINGEASQEAYRQWWFRHMITS
ncbi:MAG: bromoperoxidase [Pseudomonadota bacterium]